MPGTSAAPSQKWDAPGTSSSIAVPPASLSALANRMLWPAGTMDVAVAVHQEHRRRVRMDVRDRAGLPCQVGDLGGRRAEEQRLTGRRIVAVQAGQVGDGEPGQHAVHVGAGERGEQRQVPAGRIAPQRHRAGGDTGAGRTVAGRTVAVQRGAHPGHGRAHVVDRGRVARLAAEPVVDGRDGYAPRGELRVEVLAECGKRVAPRAAPPPAPVHVDHDGHRASTGRIRQVEVEFERPEPRNLRVLDVPVAGHPGEAGRVAHAVASSSRSARLWNRPPCTMASRLSGSCSTVTSSAGKPSTTRMSAW